MKKYFGKSIMFILLLNVGLSLQAKNIEKVKQDWTKSWRANGSGLSCCYGYAYNLGTQHVGPDGFVTFDTIGPDNKCVEAPFSGGSDFKISCSGVYLIEYHVRGLPAQHSPPAPLIFELLQVKNVMGGQEVTTLCGTNYASNNADNALKDGDNEAAYGFALAEIVVEDSNNPVIIRLHNSTYSAVSSVDVLLKSQIRGGSSVINASLGIIKIACLDN